MAAAELPIEIGVDDVAGLLAAGEDFLLLDCREATEYEVASIPGAVLLPMSEIQDRIDELTASRNQLVVVHCHHGGRSLRVALWLRQQGFDRVQSMAGGIDAWSQQIDDSIPRY